MMSDSVQYIPRNRSSFIDQLNPFINRIFQHAVMRGDMAVITLMLKHGIVVKRNQRNPHGLTALQQSVLDGNSRLAIMLLEFGADLEAKTSNGWTCLHIASATGDICMVKLLLAHCADIVALTGNEELPIDLAMNADMKILLTNEMSRCGYIELSQWYMGKIAQQESGVFYVMSADSLIDIACDRPDTLNNVSYDSYHQNYMQTYSSMINLSLQSISDANIGGQKAKKPSAWSLAQPTSTVNRLISRDICDDTYSYTLPTKGRIERSLSRTDRTLEIPRDTLKKSSSSASVIERAYCVQNMDLYENGSDGRSGNQHLSHNVVEAVSASSQCLSVSDVDNGPHGNSLRRNSLRRKKSSPHVSEKGPIRDEVDHRLELTIDYFKESLDYDDKSDDENDYLEFKRSKKQPWKSSTSSEGSLSDNEALILQEAEHLEVSCGNGDTIADDRELLQEFADPYSSNSHFEIDTDNMDQYVINSDGSVDQILPSIQNISSKSFENCDAYGDECNGNMYFNPMYTSTDIRQSEAGIPNLDDNRNVNEYESDQDGPFDWLSSESGSPDYNRMGQHEKVSPEDPSRANFKPYEIYSEETEVICNETELIERKRKKKGLLSELVSRFKKGSSKLHRTSSDTNLNQNEDSSVVRRDTRKVKTLRRRRHVRRSNSFSSYFTLAAEKSCKDTRKGENKDSGGRENGQCNANQRSITAPPYSPHRRQKRSATPQESRKAPPQVMQKYSSLPRQGTKGLQSMKAFKKYGNSLYVDEEWMDINSPQSWKGDPSQTDMGSSRIDENKVSKIPTRSVNTYVPKDLTAYEYS